MRAAIQDHYGAPEVLQIQEVTEPTPGPKDILVEVHATSVTTADWRFRAAAFPRGMRLVGRLVAGLLRPRNRLSGREFAGRVVKVGSEVTRFAPGDDVLGISNTGANADRIVVPDDATLVHKPVGLSHAEAVSIPFGALTAIEFVLNIAKVRPGERVLVAGASGGVGVHVVQLAKHLGAEVTAVCSGANADFVRAVGADHVIDYKVAPAHRVARETGQKWDVVFDVAGVTKFEDYRDCLAPNGRHAFIEGTLREALQSLTTKFGNGPKVLFGVAPDTQAALEKMSELIEEGAFRPVIGHRFDLEDIVDAHRLVESRHRRGAVVLDVVHANTATVPLRRAG